MTWIRLEDTFPEHPKVDAAGGDAAWLHICAMGYCARNNTEGKISRNRLARLSDRKNPDILAAKLVEVGLWELHETGWIIHDYLDYNPTKAEVEEHREKTLEAKAAAGKLGGIASGIARRSKHEANTKQAASEIEAPCLNETEPKRSPIPSHPFPDTTNSVNLRLLPEPARTDNASKREQIAKEFARLSWEQANQSLIQKPEAFRTKQALKALADPELDRYLTEYPTATGTEIACWLHGETNTQRYHNRVTA